MSKTSELLLFTINMSHYSEKIRWLLDYEGIAYREVALTPALHSLPMLLKGKKSQTTVPLVQRDDVCVQNSPRIVDWLAQEYGPLKSLPEASKQEILAIQQRFDAIGKPVARYLYLPGFAHGGLIKDIWTQFAKPWERTFIHLMYPLIKPVFKIKLKVNKQDVARAEQKINTQIEWLEEKLQQGDYLVGNTLTVADITAASILAPLACPKEHPIYGTDEFREKMAEPAQQWQNSAALSWVRKIYAQHRGVVWTIMPTSSV